MLWDESRVVDRWREYFHKHKPIGERDEDKSEEIRMIIKNTYEHDEKINKEEIMSAIGRLKCDKSPGTDGGQA